MKSRPVFFTDSGLCVLKLRLRGAGAHSGNFSTWFDRTAAAEVIRTAVSYNSFLTGSHGRKDQLPWTLIVPPVFDHVIALREMRVVLQLNRCVQIDDSRFLISQTRERERQSWERKRHHRSWTFWYVWDRSVFIKSFIMITVFEDLMLLCLLIFPLSVCLQSDSYPGIFPLNRGHGLSAWLLILIIMH